MMQPPLTLFCNLSLGDTGMFPAHPLCIDRKILVLYRFSIYVPAIPAASPIILFYPLSSLLSFASLSDSKNSSYLQNNHAESILRPKKDIVL